jgi:ribonuclease HI
MVIYTDGACSGNGGPNSRGGFGVVVVGDDGQIIKVYQKQCENTTNNREELKAILWALWNYGNKTNPPTIYSDSAYCVNSLNTWVWGWRKNGWTKSDGRTPENIDLMSAYVELINKGYCGNLQKVKGHAGNIYNEMADKLATGKTTIKIEE